VLAVGASSAADADAVIAIAKQAGFLISAEDLEQAQAQTELSDTELEQVTGGVGGLFNAVFDFSKQQEIKLTAGKVSRDQLSDSSAFNDIHVG